MVATGRAKLRCTNKIAGIRRFSIEMMKKPNGNYESPFIKLLPFDANDIVTASGDNFFEWDWTEDSTSSDDGMFN